MNYQRWTTLLALAGCEAFEEDAIDVEYERTCETVQCFNTTDTFDYSSLGDRAFTCRWHCADYRGNSSSYVELTFWSWDGGCWELETEFIASGICGY